MSIKMSNYMSGGNIVLNTGNRNAQMNTNKNNNGLSQEINRTNTNISNPQNNGRQGVNINSLLNSKNPYCRKRKFTELDGDTSIGDNIEKGISLLTISKRYKLGGGVENPKYIQHDYQVPASQYMNVPKEIRQERKSIRMITEEIDMIDSNETEKTISPIDMELERIKVEEYYKTKNKLLFQAMFEN